MALGVVGDVVLEGVDDVDIERIVVDQAKDKLQTNLVELVSLEDVFNLLDPLADCVCLLLCLQTKHVSFFSFATERTPYLQELKFGLVRVDLCSECVENVEDPLACLHFRLKGTGGCISIGNTRTSAQKNTFSLGSILLDARPSLE